MSVLYGHIGQDGKTPGLSTELGTHCDGLEKFVTVVPQRHSRRLGRFSLTAHVKTSIKEAVMMWLLT